MDKNRIQTLARELIAAHPDALNNPDNLILHLGQVYDLTEIIVKNIRTKYNNIPITDEVVLASGLHDIGRPLEKDQTFHGLRGANYIEQEGLKQAVANSVKDTYRIAQMIRSHAFAYEHWTDPDCAKLKKEFVPLESCLLVPRTWQEAIVTYSDLASLNGERIKVEDRMKELIHRYENDPRYHNGIVVRGAKTALNRILELAERVEALEQGKLTEQEILRFGFL